jgi:hypothetical protein
LCTIGLLHGEKLLAHYRFCLKPEQFALQRLQRVRKALRTSLTNLKKTYHSLMDLSFPELGHLLELDGVGIRKLLSQAPTPAAIRIYQLLWHNEIAQTQGGIEDLTHRSRIDDSTGSIESLQAGQRRTIKSELQVVIVLEYKSIAGARDTKRLASDREPEKFRCPKRS